jgi:hypothetical protein
MVFVVSLAFITTQIHSVNVNLYNLSETVTFFLLCIQSLVVCEQLVFEVKRFNELIFGLFVLSVNLVQILDSVNIFNLIKCSSEAPLTSHHVGYTHQTFHTILIEVCRTIPQLTDYSDHSPRIRHSLRKTLKF